MKGNGYPVAILGGGIAGLTAARFLRAHGVPVALYDSGPRLAGMAASFKDDDGFSYDFGAHFITNRLAAAIGAGALCRDVRHYGEAVHLNGRTYSYPFGFLTSPKLAASAVAARFAGSSPPESVADYFQAQYGRAMAEQIANPLVEAWSGVPASQLAPAVADKIPSSIFQTAFLHVARTVTRRAVAIGYCREQPESVNVWHVYPMGGVATLCAELAKGLEDAIQLNSPVEAIYIENDRPVAVQVNGRERPVAAVVSTAPCNVLPKLVRGSSKLSPLARFRYRPMVFVNLRFEGRGLLPDVVCWTPEHRFPFFRLTEAPLSMPWLAPAGKTLITADIGCEKGDAMWSKPDDELGELCLDSIGDIVPGARARYLGCRVLRTPIAYPVFLNEYEQDRRRFAQSTGIDLLYSIGRNGEFDHILMEDVYWRAISRMRSLLYALQSPPIRIDQPEFRHKRPPVIRPEVPAHARAS